MSEEEEEEQGEGEEWEEVDPKPPTMDVELEQSKEDQEGEQEPSRQRSQDWEMVMGEEEMWGCAQICGEGVASCRPPSDLGGPFPRFCGHFQAIL